MKQTSAVNVVVWIWLAVYLLAAGVLVLGGIFMFFAGFFRG